MRRDLKEIGIHDVSRPIDAEEVRLACELDDQLDQTQQALQALDPDEYVGRSQTSL